MKTVAIAGTMHVDLDVIERIAAEYLGMRPAADAEVVVPPPLDLFEVRPLITPDLDAALATLISATDRLERDEHTRAEHMAVLGLIKAAKQVRLAVRQINALKVRKGKVNA